MNVFLIYTPLHSLIASKIIERYELNEYYLIYISRSRKDKLYYDRLAVNASKSYFIKLTPILFSLIKLTFISLIIKFKYSKINFYTGNPKTFISRFFLIFQKFDIFTFDDGFDNIEERETAYLKVKTENKYSNIFFCIFNRNLLYRNLFEIITKHFTIFTQPNSFNNTEYIKLIDASIYSCNSHQTVNLLLASCIYEYDLGSLDDEILLYKQTIDKYSIDIIIDHPASINIKFFDGNVNKLYKGDLIAEEFILNLLSESNVCVYGFESSALYVLKGINNNITTIDLGCCFLDDLKKMINR